MEIIKDIINELVSTEKSLTSPLFKAKFLAKRIGNDKLLEWIDLELNGYKPKRGEDRDSHVPEYRKFGATLLGTYTIYDTPFENLPLPTFGLEDNIANFVRSITLFESVSSLEKKSENNNSGKIALIIPPEICSIIQTYLRKNNKYVTLFTARKETSSTVIIEALTSIRSKFLDFMLELDSQFGDFTDINELITKNEQITKFMNHIIINNSGDGALINTGDSATIENNIQIQKGNLESLESTLRLNKIAEEDILEIKNILKIDVPNQEKEVFGEKTKNWISKMLSKSLNGSWAIGIGAAGKLLADAIKAFYGWH